MFSLRRKELQLYIEADILRNRKGLVHAFGTRWSADDIREDQSGNNLVDGKPFPVEGIASVIGARPCDIVMGVQVHGDHIVVIEDGSADKIGTKMCGGTPVCDGFITNRSWIAPAVRTADCVPLLIYDPRRRVVGMIHAGWKGTALSIASKAVDIFMKRFCSDPSELVSVIGPAAGPCCYEVGPEVYESMEHNPWAREVFSPQKFGGKCMLDLGSALRYQLLGQGLSPANIDILPLCTVCRDDLFHSRRGQGEEAGRQVSAVMLTD